jgi:hypothetical protein
MRAGRRGDRVALTIGPRQLRGGVAAAESPPARPTLGGSRSIERGCTGRAGRCSRPRRKFGFRRRRAPSVRRRRRVCHCVSAQPCLDCSPTQAGQTLLGLAIPLAGRTRCGRVGSVAACRVLLPCGAGRYGWARSAGWAWHEGLSPTGLNHPGSCGGMVGCRASPDRRAGRGVQGPRKPARSAAVDPGPGQRLDAGSCLPGWAAVVSA